MSDLDAWFDPTHSINQPEPRPVDPMLLWMQELGAEVDRRHVEHRGAYRSLDWEEWRPYFDRGMSPASALDADLKARGIELAPVKAPNP